MKIEKALNQYQEASEAIVEYFDAGVHQPQLMLDNHWYVDQEDIYYAEEDEYDPEDLESFNYSYTSRLVCVKEEYTAAKVRDCFGDEFWVIFDNDKRVEI